MIRLIICSILIVSCNVPKHDFSAIANELMCNSYSQSSSVGTDGRYFSVVMEQCANIGNNKVDPYIASSNIALSSFKIINIQEVDGIKVEVKFQKESNPYSISGSYSVEKISAILRIDSLVKSSILNKNAHSSNADIVCSYLDLELNEKTYNGTEEFLNEYSSSSLIAFSTFPNSVNKELIQYQLIYDLRNDLGNNASMTIVLSDLLEFKDIMLVVSDNQEFSIKDLRENLVKYCDQEITLI